MSFVLEYRETDPEGSFVASGAGLRYRYDADRRLLDVIERGRKSVVVRLDVREVHPRNVPSYTTYLEKINQIKALMYSNSRTVNLTRTLGRMRLSAIVQGDSLTAWYAYDLSRHRFADFSENFRTAFDLEQVYINQLRATGPADGHDYYAGTIKSRSGNMVSARAPTLPALLYLLAERTAQDLAGTEYRSDTAAQKLLSASLVLNTTARALDENFIPDSRIKTPEAPKLKAQFQLCRA